MMIYCMGNKKPQCINRDSSGDWLGDLYLPRSPSTSSGGPVPAQHPSPPPELLHTQPPSPSSAVVLHIVTYTLFPVPIPSVESSHVFTMFHRVLTGLRPGVDLPVDRQTTWGQKVPEAKFRP